MNCNAEAFGPIPSRLPGLTKGKWIPPRKRIPLRDSVLAIAFLFFYLAVYLAAGFAGIAALEWAWGALFR